MRGITKNVKVSIVLGLMLFMCLLQVQPVFAEVEERTVVKTYEAGAEVTAVLYSDGELELSGSGETNDWSASSIPWAAEKSTIVSVKVGEGITCLGNNAFNGCTALAQIDLCEDLVTLKKDVFKNCTSLTEIRIPSMVESVNSNGIFAGCTKLTKVTFAYGMTKVPAYICRGMTALTTIEYETSGEAECLVTEIGQYAFYQCSELSKVTLPKNTTKIGYKAFQKCTALSEIAFNDSLQQTDGYAFAGCTALTELKLPAALTGVNSSTFSGCTNVTKVTFSYGTTKVPDYVCSGMSGLTTVVYETENSDTQVSDNSAEQPEGKACITEIGSNAFNGCSSLTGAVLPETVKSIGYRAFYNCKSLAEITVPKSLESIDSDVFYGCTNITKVTFSYGMTKVPDNMCRGMSGLTTVIYETEDSDAQVSINSTEQTEGKTCITEIGSRAFYGCSSLTSAPIPETVKSIGASAFYGCSSLTELTVPKGLEMLGNNVFSGCNKLTKVTFSYGMTKVPNNMCYGMTSLTTVVYETENSDVHVSGNSTEEPVGKTCIIEIGNYAFYNCSSLTVVPLPETVTKIGSSAFYGCKNLTELTVPKNLESIGSYVFNGCVNLKKVTFPYGIKEVPNYICQGMSGLTTVVFEKGIPEPESGEEGTLKEESSITRIGSYAFYGCTSLTEMVIPENTVEIDYDAFYGCTSLSEVKFNDTLNTLGSYAFYNCTSLTEIKVPKTLTSVGSGAFSGCTAITKIIFPYGMTKVPDYMCYGMSKLTTVVYETGIPEPEEGQEAKTEEESSITSIGSYAFCDCSALERIEIPENTKTIGRYAYEYCDNANIVLGGDSVEEMGYGVFYTSSSKDLIVGADNEVLRKYDWKNDNRNPLFPIKQYESGKNIKVKFFADGVMLIEGIGRMEDVKEDAVPWSEEITSVNTLIIGSKVTGIGSYALAGSKLSYLELEDHIAYVGEGAFKNCDGLISIKIGNGVKEIGEKAFYTTLACDTLLDSESQSALDYNWLEDNRVIRDDFVVYPISKGVQGIFYNGHFRIIGSGYMADYASSSLPWKDQIITKVTVSEGIKSIGNYSFSEQVSLTDISLPKSLRRIGAYAFSGCTALAEADVPAMVNEIGDAAFRYCEKLVSIEIKDTKITQIPHYCFEGCSSLRKIEFPKSVKGIGSAAFMNCVALGDIELHEGIVSIDDRAFWNCDRLTTLKIPRSLSSTDYHSSKGPFADCDNIKSASFALKSRKVPDYLFAGCTSLEKVVFQDTITEIGRSAFNNCVALKEVVLPRRMTIIRDSAFYGCSMLEHVEWNEDLQEIGASAFFNCSKLDSVKFTDMFTRVNSYSFYGTAIEEIVLPYKISYIGYEAFAIDTLKKISIPAQTKVIEDDAFGSLTELVIAGKKGSVAETFANEKGFTFVDGSSVSSIAISETDIQMSLIDSAYELFIDVEPMDTTDEIIWTTSDEEVVEIYVSDEDGTRVSLYPRKVGEVQITATVGNLTEVCHVSVGNYVTDLSLSEEYLYFTSAPDTKTLYAYPYPNNAQNAELVWTTSDSNVAVVDQEGKVTAVGNGMARIVVRTTDSTIQATCFVKVDAFISAQQVVMEKKEVFLSGGQKQLKASVLPANTTNPTLQWSSSDTNVVTVDENGMLAAVSDGEAVITAQAQGGVSDTCKVTVQFVDVPVTGVDISEKNIVLDDTRRSVQLTANVIPANADVQDVFWSSSDDSVAVVDETGKVYAQSGGIAEITAVSKDGDFEAKCVVTVTELVRKLEISPLEVWLKPGETTMLEFKTTPASKLEIEKEWYSTNTNVVTVDQTGKVYAVANGEAYIKCHTLDGTDLLAACKVHVGEGYISLSGIALSHSKMNLYVGESAKLGASLQPANATRKELNFVSSNSQIVKISADGTMTALQKGTAVITVSSVHESGIKSQCVVTVSEKAQQVQNGEDKQPEKVVVKAPGKVKLKSVKAGKKQMTVKWKKKKGNGYQIQYSTSKKFKSKKTVTVKSYKLVSKKIKKLKSKKTYYVRVRAYKKVNGKTYYGAWSNIKKVKIK